MKTTTEQLVTCTFCGRSGFTRRGLRAHWCDHGEKGQKTKLLTQEEWQSMVAPRKAPESPPKAPEGRNMLDITCGQCGHLADWDAFHRDGLPREFRCPKCEHTWKIVQGDVEKVIHTPEGGYDIRSKWSEKIGRPIITVPFERMKDELWYRKDGDIRTARVTYSSYGKVQVRKTFEHEGEKWVSWGGSETRAVCTQLLPWNREAVIPEKRPYCHENEIVTVKGLQYVCGPEVEFVAAPRGPASEAEHCRRLYAFGGMFAAEAGSYDNLLKKWLAEKDHTPMQRVVWETEIAADLPQTQEGMRAFLGEERPGVPRHESKRFNPLTGKTN
jgi:hypothetical protein